MRRRYTGIIFAFLFLALCLVTMTFKSPVYAAETSVVLEDEADLFTAKEEKSLLKKLARVSEKRDCDIGVITTGDLQGKSAVDYVDDALTYNRSDKSHGAVRLLIYINDNDESDREVRIATDETASAYFSDNDNETIIDDMIGDLSAGHYADAAMTYADSCDRILGQSLDGNDGGSRGVSPLWLFGDLGIGAVIAYLLGSFQKGKLKSRKRKGGAADYKAEGGIDFTVNRDVFLNRRVERRRIERDDREGPSHEAGTTHTTSSGEKHGGAGRKF